MNSPSLASARRSARQHGLDAIEHLPIDDGRVLAFVHLAAIGDLADIEPVLQHVGERADCVSLREAP